MTMPTTIQEGIATVLGMTLLTASYVGEAIMNNMRPYMGRPIKKIGENHRDVDPGRIHKR